MRAVRSSSFALLLSSAFMLPDRVLAQCPGCNPDLACMVSPAYPTLCPAAPPDATAGAPYAADITFWLPQVFTDPGSGFTVDFEQMTVTGVTGLPFGLEIETNEASGVYYPQQSQYGCARICGTPIGAGTYTITISILAGVSYNGFDLNVPQQFALVLNVLPGSGGNTGFSFTPSTGCGSAQVSFTGLIDGAPSSTTYAWDFGNGNSGSGVQPPPQTYDGPGTHTITLQTIIGGFVLNSVALTGVNDNWCGDVEEPNIPFVGCSGNPDPYFVLTDAQGGTWTSGTVDDSGTGDWNGLGLVLGDPPYSIAFYDEDVVSQNDLLGTYNIPANGSGTYFINVAGGTTGSLVISEEAQQVFTHTDSVLIFPQPSVLLEANGAGELCAAVDEAIGYTWFLDGDTVPEASGPCFLPTGPGVWTVTVINGYGCTATSNAVVVCPTVTIAHNGNVLYVASGFETYAWTYEGTSVGGNDAFLFTQGDGDYAVTVTDTNGCEVTDAFTLITTGLDGAANDPTVHLAVFPVPNKGAFTVVATELKGSSAELRILDLAGRVVYSTHERLSNGGLRMELLLNVPPGAYAIQLTDATGTRTARLVVQ